MKRRDILKRKATLIGLLAFSLVATTAFSQTCTVDISTPDPLIVCPGEAVNVNAVANVYADNQSFNFNLGIMPTGWVSAGGANFGSPCGAGPGGNYFWASTAGGGTPFIQTAAFDVCTGGNLVFDMRYAVQGGGAPCEGPDEQDEGVSIEYSLDGGVTWIEFVYYSPDGVVMGANPGGNASIAMGATPFTNWGTITVPIPPAAISGNTMFRWIQYNSSGVCCDNWGLDNIFVNAGPCLDANIVWSTGETGVSSIFPVLNSDSCFVAQVYDDAGVFLCESTPICFTVPTPSINAGPDQAICDGASVTLTATGGSGFAWNNGVVNGVSFTPVATQTYTVTGLDVNGCQTSDDVIVTVSSIAAPTINPAGPFCVDGGASALAGTPLGGVFSGTGVVGGNFNPATAGVGNHTITYTYTNPSNCVSTNTMNITVNALPIVNLNPQADLCSDDPSVTLTYAPAGGVLSGIGISGSNFDPTVAGAGSHLIDYTFTDGNGCVNSDNISINVNGLPTAVIAGNADVCQNAVAPVVTFTGANGTAPYTFEYTINGGAVQSLTSVGNSATVNVSTANSGTFTYDLIGVTEGGATSCSNLQSGSVVVNVSPLPTATVSGGTTVCQDDTAPLVTFTGANSIAPYTFSYSVNGGATQTITTVVGNSVTISAPTGTSGTFVYQLIDVQASDAAACSNPQNGSTNIVVNPLPTASITGATTVCQNDTSPSVTFTGANGTAPYTFSYTINGGGIQTAITAVGNSITVPVSTVVAGNYLYELVSVQDASVTNCSNNQVGAVTVVVNPLPTGSIQGTASVCVGGVPPVITFTGANGTPSYTFSYTINGGAVQTVTSPGSNDVTVSAPTGAAGTYTYTLTQIQDASATACLSQMSSDIVITVNPLPTAAIIGTIDVCQNASSPSVTFTGANGTAPYTFDYTVNGGPVQTVASVGNSATIAQSTAIPGTYIYTLVSVTDASSTACSNPQVGNATIVVNPLPTATITGDAGVCHNSVSPEVTFTGANGTSPYTFEYSINGGGTQSVTTAVGNSVTVVVPTNVAGTFSYDLISVTDASSTTCTNAQSVSVTVNVYAYPPIDAGPNQIVCENSDAMLTASNPMSMPMWWDNNVTDGTWFSPSQTTMYTAFADNNGCISQDSMWINIEALPIVDFDMDITEGCKGTEVTFTNNSTSVSGLVNCLWEFSDGGDENGCSDVSYTFDDAGLFDVTLTTTSSNGCVNSLTLFDVIYIEEDPIASFDPISLHLTTIDTEVNFNNTTIGATSYEWDFGDYSMMSNEVNPVHIYAFDQGGEYTVELIAYSPLGCIDKAYGIIDIKEELIFYVPNTFTPDGDKYNEFFKPVFTTGYDPYSFTMYIFNRWGQIVWESHDVNAGWDGTFASTVIPDGAYTWKIEFKLSETDERKMVAGHVNILR